MRGRAARRSTPRWSATAFRAMPTTSTAPHPEGKGAELAMRMALRKAGMEPCDIDYINAHGTSTMADTIELAAAKRVFGDDLCGASMSSTKSAIGHLLGGAGAVESIFCILALRDQIVPPTLNLDDPDEGTESCRPRAARGQETRGARGAQQQLRVRRDQCQPGAQARSLKCLPPRRPPPSERPQMICPE